jgi:transposase-like protein
MTKAERYAHGPASCILSRPRLSRNRSDRRGQHQDPLAPSRARYRCDVCHQTFGARKGTPLYRRRTPQATIILVMTLVAYGCPIAAIEAAFGFQRRTVQGWVDAAGGHCERIHQHLILDKPRDLEHVQEADELQVKTQGGIVWMALAIMVSTRLWLGGATSPTRARAL